MSDHGMNCPHHADKDEACTCALTERTMHAAWRKRAEEAETRIVALEAQVKALTEERDAQAEAVRVLGEELASWRSAPYRSDILETYWADISDTDKHVIRFGLDVNNNQIASKAVKDGE